jgi:hypothetical protein
VSHRLYSLSSTMRFNSEGVAREKPFTYPSRQTTAKLTKKTRFTRRVFFALPCKLPFAHSQLFRTVHLIKFRP